MNFQQGEIYHIYNQGNNRVPIFHNRENYLFFLNKMRTYLLPHCDIIAWCLMPNHFHWMMYVRDHERTHQMTPSHQMSGAKTEQKQTEQMALSHQLSNSKKDLTENIAIMLRSYTRAINKQQNQSGSLFRAHTKAECVTCNDGITPSFYIAEFGTVINTHDIEKEYPQICFNYIHNNPVKAGLVIKPED